MFISPLFIRASKPILLSSTANPLCTNVADRMPFSQIAGEHKEGHAVDTHTTSSFACSDAAAAAASGGTRAFVYAQSVPVTCAHSTWCHLSAVLKLVVTGRAFREYCTAARPNYAPSQTNTSELDPTERTGLWSHAYIPVRVASKVNVPRPSAAGPHVPSAWRANCNAATAYP